MHYHLELIMPPTPAEQIEEKCKQVLTPFDEEGNTHGFYDWYQLAGRFSGQKLLQAFDKEKLQKFYNWLSTENVTVSGLQWGKQELAPASQIPKVDAKWREMFGGTEVCPIFKHSNEDTNTLLGDICDIKGAQHVTCSKVIITNTDYEAKFMIEDSYWNGCSWNETAWDKSVKTALEMYQKKVERYIDSYKEKNTVTDEWISVTIDYHN